VSLLSNRKSVNGLPIIDSLVVVVEVGGGRGVSCRCRGEGGNRYDCRLFCLFLLYQSLCCCSSFIVVAAVYLLLLY
jgi:hypothetical protein